jgi:hypothetical protein
MSWLKKNSGDHGREARNPAQIPYPGGGISQSESLKRSGLITSDPFSRSCILYFCGNISSYCSSDIGIWAYS